MYNPKDIQFVGKHDFDRPIPNEFLFKSFSVGIFRWDLKVDGKSMKKSHAIVRVGGSITNPDKVFKKAEEIVSLLDSGSYTGKYSLKV